MNSPPLRAAAAGRLDARGARRAPLWRAAAVMIRALAVGALLAQVFTPRLLAEGAWTLATPGRPIALPADHASHPDYKIEWWYYTGNLDAADGQRFGFQLTFFRVGVDPRPENPSRWAVRDLYMAHFAVTDVTRGRFYFFDRLQRPAAGWAGAATDRYAVWNGKWSARAEPARAATIDERSRRGDARRADAAASDAIASGSTAGRATAHNVASGAIDRSGRSAEAGGNGTGGAVAGGAAVARAAAGATGEGDAHRLQASDKDVAIDLVLRDLDRWVAHGRGGYSQKGAAPGNASHYYSLTRLKTTGSVSIAGERFAVTGLSWMDHEFGTSMLEPAQVGWDWFALQLDDGRDLMLWQMRRRDGSIDPFSSGTLVSRDGTSTHLSRDDFTLTPIETWRSPSTRATYPVRWRVSIPRARLTLDVRAPVRASELHTPRSTGVTYWEGAVDITGQSGGGANEAAASGRPVRGRGYMELTGYAGAPISESFR